MLATTTRRPTKSSVTRIGTMVAGMAGDFLQAVCEVVRPKAILTWGQAFVAEFTPRLTKSASSRPRAVCSTSSPAAASARRAGCRMPASNGLANLARARAGCSGVTSRRTPARFISCSTAARVRNWTKPLANARPHASHSIAVDRMGQPQRQRGHVGDDHQHHQKQNQERQHPAHDFADRRLRNRRQHEKI
jgi:hypothetical protein